VVIAVTVDAADVAGALGLAWESFMKAADDDPGWQLAAATAEVRASPRNALTSCRSWRELGRRD
jgi:hypothetical protein